MPSATEYTVLIDGYNVIHQHSAWRRLPMDQARQRLLGHLRSIRWPVPVGRVVAVFDSPEAQPGGADGPVRVRFASPSADADIQAQIRSSRSPQRLLIVSDDLEILRTAKSHGAQRHSCRWLLARPEPGAASPAGGREAAASADGRRSLPAAHARRITEELAKRWLTGA